MAPAHSVQSQPQVPVQAQIVVDLATLMGLADNQPSCSDTARSRPPWRGAGWRTRRQPWGWVVGAHLVAPWLVSDSPTLRVSARRHIVKKPCLFV